ncbi:MAG TPA: hypothetical protein VK929_02640 [Longimicrobiales bacterium]|nr:hypothetical protein [Longimicrobiales bacterium]
MKARSMTPAAALLALLALPTAGTAEGTAPGSAAVAEATAASQENSGWTPWLGCWRPLGDDAPLNALVCVAPGENPATVRMLSVEDGAVVDESVFTADGTARAVEDGGCTGTETATWSRDGRRVYVRTELDCDGVRRKSSGVLSLIAENEWVDVQAVEIAGQHLTRSVRYRAVRPEQVPDAVAGMLPADRSLATEAARLNAAAPMGTDDVVEATTMVAAPVVEALIALRQHGFGLDARALLALERQGVPASVLDVMIAVSHPQRFAVQEGPRSQGQAAPAGLRTGMYDDCRDPYTFRRLSRLECERRAMYGYGSSYGRFGYSPWGYDAYGWRYGQGPIVVIVEPEREERRGGQMIRGQGYTPGSSATSSGRGAQTRQPASGSSAGASSTSGSTGNSTSTGRTAVPRNNGGGGGGGTNDDGAPEDAAL